jgi:hypothetical protein
MSLLRSSPGWERMAIKISLLRSWLSALVSQGGWITSRFSIRQLEAFVSSGLSVNGVAGSRLAFPGASRLPLSYASLRNVPPFIRIVEIKKGMNIGAVFQAELFLPSV